MRNKTLDDKARDFVKKHPVDDIKDVYLAELLYFVITGKPIILQRRTG